VFGAYRVYLSVLSQKSIALKELDSIQNYITQSGSGFFTEPFRTQIQKLVADCNTLEGIIVAGPQLNLPFEKKADFIISRDPSPKFIPRFGYGTLDIRQLEIPGMGNAIVHSKFNAVNYEYLVYILRQTLFGILGALLLSFLTMMITMLRSRSAPQEKTIYAEKEEFKTDEYISFRDDEPNYDEPDEYKAETITDTYDDVFEDDFSAEQPVPLNDQEQQEQDDDFELPDNENFELPDFDDFGSDNTAAAPTDEDFHLDDFLDESDLTLPGYSADDQIAMDSPPESSTQENDSIKTGVKGSPNGLYSPRSNIGWEAYTHDRLASELHRCASSEQDLVVLRMECGDGVNCDAKLYRKIADEAVGLFNLQDLSFEYGSRGITVIIPNAGLEQGISKAETFHARLFHSCYDSFHSKNDFLTGISSRSGRLIEANRLLLEADKALEKAKFDVDSPIVAFKSDPEKYREYIKKGTP
jgi:hypothetical protein